MEKVQTFFDGLCYNNIYLVRIWNIEFMNFTREVIFHSENNNFVRFAVSLICESLVSIFLIFITSFSKPESFSGKFW